MTTVFTGHPYSAEFPSTNFPELRNVNRRPVLAFDATTQQTCQWSCKAPQGMSTGTIVAVISYMMASATSGTTDWEVSIEAVTDGDATDLDAVDSFDTINSQSVTVPGTAGYIDEVTVTIVNGDIIQPGDYFRLKLSRDADDPGSNDTATGDAYVLSIELRSGT